MSTKILAEHYRKWWAQFVGWVKRSRLNMIGGGEWEVGMGKVFTISCSSPPAPCSYKMGALRFTHPTGYWFKPITDNGQLITGVAKRGVDDV